MSRSTWAFPRIPRSHTPGTWVAEGYRDIHGDKYLAIEATTTGSSYRPSIAKVLDTFQDGELEANAWLILAAPDLYEVCRFFIARMTGNDSVGVNLADVIELAQKAIAKAEGR